MFFKSDAEKIDINIREERKSALCTICNEPKDNVVLTYSAVSFNDGPEYIIFYFPQGKEPDMICEDCMMKKERE